MLAYFDYKIHKGNICKKISAWVQSIYQSIHDIFLCCIFVLLLVKSNRWQYNNPFVLIPLPSSVQGRSLGVPPATDIKWTESFPACEETSPGTCIQHCSLSTLPLIDYTFFFPEAWPRKIHKHEVRDGQIFNWHLILSVKETTDRWILHWNKHN